MTDDGKIRVVREGPSTYVCRKTVYCYDCESELDVPEELIKTRWLFFWYVYCPICKKECRVWESSYEMM